MLLVFDEVKRGHYQRNASIRPEKRRDSIDEAEAALSPHGPQVGQVVDLTQLPGGEVVDTEASIILKNVPIITPTGDMVVTSLSFEVGTGIKLLIILYQVLGKSVTDCFKGWSFKYV